MFDLIFVLILSITSLLAFIKGFLKSFFSLLNWILASVISYFLTPIVATMFSEGYSYLALHSVVSVILFVIALVALSIFTSSITKTFLSVIPESVDKSLGFAFGFAKGYFIVALVFVVITTIYAANLPIFASRVQAQDGRYGPKWLIESKSYKIITIGADIWQPLIDKVSDMLTNSSINDKKDDLDEKINEIQDDLDNVEKAKEIYDTINDLSNQGYHKDEIEKMDRLIETIQ